jgi:carboxymethylenebutenolidase
MQDNAGQIGRAEFIETAGDKRAYFAVPAGSGPFPGVLVFQEAFGINGYMQNEVKRLAARGYAAIAPDLFDGETFDYDELDKVFPRMSLLTDDGMLEHVDDAVRYLDAQPEVKHGRYGAVGFCMGGRLAFLTAVSRPQKIAAAASFYGGGIAPEKQRMFPPLLDRVPDLGGELLLIYGADDEGITPQEHARLTEALSMQKKRYRISVYPGAGHGFASTDRVPAYEPNAAEAAWAETLALFDRTLR